MCNIRRRSFDGSLLSMPSQGSFKKGGFSIRSLGRGIFRDSPKCGAVWRGSQLQRSSQTSGGVFQVAYGKHQVDLIRELTHVSTVASQVTVRGSACTLCTVR